ncbi:MAG: hypothetical protein RIG77_17920 [Cyclobacteriaceae bacterium]
MKNLILIITSIVLITGLYAQSPKGFKYQAVIRDNEGEPLGSQDVSFRISILKSDSQGESQYSETHIVKTSEFGLVSLVIGDGTAVSGNFSEIDWGIDQHFLQLEVDKSGSTNYQLMGTTQLLSVPYALHAETVGEKQTLEIEGSILKISDGNQVVLPSSGFSSSVLMLIGDVTDQEASNMISNMETISHVFVGNTSNLTTLDLSSVTSAVEVRIFNNQGLLGVDLSNLEMVFSDLFIRESPITQLTLGSLEFVGSNQLHSNSLSIADTKLTSLDLNSLVTGNLNITSNALLSSIELGSFDGLGALNLSNNALTSESINQILAYLVSITPPITDRYITLNNQTPPAPPTGQGLVDENTLSSNGNTVITDFKCGTYVNLLTAGLASISKVTNPNGIIVTDDWEGFKISFTGNESGGTYATTVSNLNDASLSNIMAPSGTWSFSNGECNLINISGRFAGGDRATVLSLTSSNMTLTFDVVESDTNGSPSPGDDSIGGIPGTWVLDFTFNE